MVVLWRAFLHKKRANRTNKHKDTSRTKQHLPTNTNDFLLAHLHKLLARALANHLPVASALYALARQLGVVSCVSLTAGAFKMLRRFPFVFLLVWECSRCFASDGSLVRSVFGNRRCFLFVEAVSFVVSIFVEGFSRVGKLFALLLSGKVAVVFSLVLFCS